MSRRRVGVLISGRGSNLKALIDACATEDYPAEIAIVVSDRADAGGLAHAAAASIPSAVVEGMELCRDGGKYLVLGHYCDAGPVLWNPHVITRKQLQVFGSWSSEPRHLKQALEFLREIGRAHV